MFSLWKATPYSISLYRSYLHLTIFLAKSHSASGGLTERSGFNKSSAKSNSSAACCWLTRETILIHPLVCTYKKHVDRNTLTLEVCAEVFCIAYFHCKYIPNNAFFVWWHLHITDVDEDDSNSSPKISVILFMLFQVWMCFSLFPFKWRLENAS